MLDPPSTRGGFPKLSSDEFRGFILKLNHLRTGSSKVAQRNWFTEQPVSISHGRRGSKICSGSMCMVGVILDV